MLTADKLCVSHGATPILQDLSLAIEPGALTALLGRNGAGKSTLMKALAGEFHGLAPARTTRVRGTLTLNGEALQAIGSQRLARLRAVLPQASHPAFPFSVEEIVLLGRYPHARPASAPAVCDRDIAHEALELAGAAPLAGRDVTTLSGGECARVQFARVLAQLWPGEREFDERNCGGKPAPRYLLLDEPTAALDLAHQHHLLATVRRLTRDWHLGALAIVHDPNLAARHADRIALLVDGAILAQGAPRDMMRPDLIERCFGFSVRMLDAGADAPPVAVPA
ncbi:heme ABC transporter ATP-binding protein [Trinickia terrae]|uniref:Heme ABC transporter ATP-binding protein n=1 Tax=Trinickia terrae TaxID=2571161 RepID=A0A4U1IF62_9BURK|nr:heme ABC transporter ATP-binding protein [Trinickia terrae]TKC92366.1 heme ABC transporter ATP-binding protein [Trinickia terrae]